jgi:hypothetical protein
VLPDSRADDELLRQLAARTVAGAREIEQRMGRDPALGQPTPARFKIVR